MIKKLFRLIAYPFTYFIGLMKRKKPKKIKKTTLEFTMDLLESRGYSMVVDVKGDYFDIKATKKS